MGRVPMNIVNKILKEEYDILLEDKLSNDMSLSTKCEKVKLYNKNKTFKRTIPYSDYILSKINSFNDLVNYSKSKQIVIISFVYNSGFNIKSYNNRCEFEIRVNREDKPINKVFLLNKLEVEQIITILKNLKGEFSDEYK